MKKLIPIVLMLCLLLCACGNDKTGIVPEPGVIREGATASPHITTVPGSGGGDKGENLENNYDTAVAAANGIGASCKILEKGTVLSVDGQNSAFYSVSYEGSRYYACASDIQLEGNSFPAKGTVKIKDAELYSFITTEGQKLFVVTKGDSTCLVSDGIAAGNIPRWALRFEGEKAYAAWSGVSTEGAWLYHRWQMTDSPKRLNNGLFISVLLETDDGLYVKAGDEYGFMFISDIERTDQQPAEDSYPEWTPPKL